MIRQTARISLRGVALLVLLNLGISPAWATQRWFGLVVTGNWSCERCWDSFSLPTAGEDVVIVFNDGTARTVTYDVSAPSLGLLSIDLTGPGTTAATLSMPSNHSLTANGILVGGHSGAAPTAGRGALNQSAGTVTTNPNTDFVVGYGAGSMGVYTLSGGALASGQNQYIGFSGTGTFNHAGGSNTINASAAGIFSVGRNPGSMGAYNLSGAGALVANTSEYIGNSGKGVFNQTGGTNTINGAGNSLYLGFGLSGLGGTYNLSGGTVTAPAAYVGHSSTGGTSSFLITGGAGASNGDAFIGFLAGSTGTATVDGLGSKWEIADIIEVGKQGMGELSITGGATLSTSIGYIGRESGSTGTAIVDGAASKWTNTGELHVGTLGTARLRVQNGGVVSASGGVSVNNALSQVTGDGTIVGNLTNRGTVSPGLVTPGNSTGTLHIAGDYSQGLLGPDLGKLQIELASPTKFDKLDVTGNVALVGAALEVSLTGGYVPQGGIQFDILDWGGSLFGAFTNVQLPTTLGGLITWDTSQLYTKGVLSVIGPPPILAGDYNKNGVVDASDYVVWRNGLGTIYTQADYDVWRAHFGQTAGSGAAGYPLGASAQPPLASVPEPTSWMLLCLGILAIGGG